jgi:hypothetical protein
MKSGAIESEPLFEGTGSFRCVYLHPKVFEARLHIGLSITLLKASFTLLAMGSGVPVGAKIPVQKKQSIAFNSGVCPAEGIFRHFSNL